MRKALVAATILTGIIAAAASAQHFSPWSTAQKIDEIAGNHADLNTPSLDGCPIQFHTAVQENPEAARQKVADLKAKIQTLSPEDQAQIRAGIEELRSRAQNLPPEQQAQLQEIVATIRG
jgi:outer membrane murein-binding lipoprotein Lpp